MVLHVILVGNELPKNRYLVRVVETQILNVYKTLHNVKFTCSPGLSMTIVFQYGVRNTAPENKYLNLNLIHIAKIIYLIQ